MPTFQSKPYRQSQALNPLVSKVKKHPFILFGLPFIGIIVGGSFALSQITQTRFDHRDMRHTKVCFIVFCNNRIYYSCYGCYQVAKEEALGMDKNRRKLSLQEEYWVRRRGDDEMVHHVTRLTIYNLCSVYNPKQRKNGSKFVLNDHQEWSKLMIHHPQPPTQHTQAYSS